MSTTKFVGGMLVNTVLIGAGVTFLLWLSTLPSSDIASKMEFYGTTAGKTTASMLCLVATFVVFIKIVQGPTETKRLLLLIVGMLVINLLIAAYTPVVVELFRGTAADIGEALIRTKGE